MWSITQATAAPDVVQAVVDGLSEGVIVRDADNRALFCNAAAEAITGLSAEELADFPLLPDGWTAVDADGRTMVPGEHAAAVCRRSGEPVRGMLTGLRRPDGTLLWLSVNARRLDHLRAADAGAGGTVVVSFLDVTEAQRLAAEHALLERRLQRVNAFRLAAGPAMVQAAGTAELLQRTCEIAVRDAGFLLAWIGVPDRRTGRVRPLASSGATGYLDDLVITLDQADPRSQGPTGVAVREGRPVVNRDIGTDEFMTPWREQALAHGFGASAAFPLQWDGDRGVFMVYAAERDFFNEEEVRLLQQFVDDLALGLREAAGRRFLATLADNMGEGLIALDREGRLRYVNGAAIELLGWTRADLEGRHLHELLHPAVRGRAPCTAGTCALLGALSTGTDVRAEDEFARAGGRTLPVSYNATALDADAATGTIIVFSDDTQRRAEECRVREQLARLSWAARIRDALAEDRFELHAQPIVEIASGATVQHELLIRMRGADGALIPPAAFLPTAEACGLMPGIDRWVVEQVARLVRAGHPVEFNLSAASLADPEMLPFIEATLVGLAEPGRIVCEVTETAFVGDRVVAEAFLSRLEALGIDVALDDFGSGYGGFSYLKAFPAKYLKIDAEFVGDLADHPASRHVVEAIVRLARALGKRTVAEGVEDLRALPLLQELGVDRAQGFALGCPRPVSELLPG